MNVNLGAGLNIVSEANGELIQEQDQEMDINELEEEEKQEQKLAAILNQANSSGVNYSASFQNLNHSNANQLKSYVDEEMNGTEMEGNNPGSDY